MIIGTSDPGYSLLFFYGWHNLESEKADFSRACGIPERWGHYAYIPNQWQQF